MSWPPEAPGAPGPLRLLLRLVHVWAIILGHLAGAAGEKVRSPTTRRGRAGPPVGPRRLRRALEDLGVGFVKLGQLLAARAELLPDPYRSELSRLRDDVTPLPAGVARQEVERALGRPLASVFASFSPEPVAAASISQVHRATLAGGRPVAVKVRRPGVATTAQADIALLGLAAGLVDRLSRRARLVDPAGIVAEVGAMLAEELDFVAEAEHATAIGQAFTADPTVVVPEILPELSGREIIVMDYLEGISLGDPEALEAAGYSRNHYAASVIRANVALVLGESLFHADLHPGNLLALPGGRLGLLDFGATGDATSETTSRAVNAIVDAIASGDAGALAAGVLMVTTASGPLDEAQLARDLDRALLQPLSGESLGGIQTGRLLRDLVGVMHRHRLRVNADVTALVRAVMTCEATARELDPGISFRRVVVPFLVSRAFGLPAPVAAPPEPEATSTEPEAPVPPAGGGPEDPDRAEDEPWRATAPERAM
jgi:ubiquinone biosynthesis protein